ncbi:helix-turn-helix transcriptional regulator [Halobacillus locisalis]|uniref:helix-turn-helix domain-containing protein n=1 Tax=Halobacillus locisalis TaxID=220753 RepID=UPI0031B5FBA4
MFGEWNKEMRKARGWSQREMSKLSGIPQTTISGWENGSELSTKWLVHLCRVFDIRMEELPFEEMLDQSENAKSKSAAEAV